LVTYKGKFMNESINERIKQLEPELIKIRRDIHQHPETGFKETRTSQLIVDYLEKLGVSVHRGLATTGVVGTLHGARSGTRVIGLRADMDALPMQEKSGVAHASVYGGITHACGHDGNTAMLLGAARYLVENRDFYGTVRFIFQPAEEGLGGGRVMVEEGLFDQFPCDAVYGMHGIPGLAAGEFAIRSGSFMASSDTWSALFKGTGGHGALPHQGTDPFLPAAALVTALPSIVSRNLSSEDAAVVSVGHFTGGHPDAPNIIPSEVLLKGTARCYTPDVRDLLERRIRELAQAQAAAYGCEVDVHYLRRYPPLINSATETQTAIQAATKAVGEKRVNGDASRLTAAEDFAFMLEKVPGAYIHIGCGKCAGIHTPQYDFNDEVIVPGVAYWVNLVLQELSQTKF